MPRKRLSSLERKQTIQTATSKLFLTHGYQQTSMQAIAQASELSFGGLYHHYTHPRQILIDLIKTGDQLRSHQLMKKIKSYNTTPTPQDLAELIVDKLLNFNDYTRLYVIVLQEVKFDAELKELYDEIKQSSIQNYQHLFKELSLTPPSSTLFEFINDIINSFYLSFALLGTQEQFTQHRDLLLTMFQCLF